MQHGWRGSGGVECAQLWTYQLYVTWGRCTLLYGVSAGICPHLGGGVGICKRQRLLMR